MSVKALILSGDGLNCERETARAFGLAGAKSTIIHINDLLEKPSFINDFQIMAIPGGFSFGDEVSSGQILALKMRHGLKGYLQDFVDAGKLIIGVCNGFQTLVKLGLLPYPKESRILSLTHNKNRQFIDRWIEMKSETNHCIWTKGIHEIYLPVRHGEGRIVFSDNTEFEKLKNNGQVVFQYTEDINGSYEKIAGLCDPCGRVFGLMPHPEAAVNQLLLPFGNKENKEAPGLQIFKNATEFAMENLL